MRSNSKRIRKAFNPLSTACTIVSLTPNSPVTQVYDGEEYEPCREFGTGTVLCPRPVISGSKGTFQEGQVNRLLANIKWYVNGVDISTISAWRDMYSIDETTGNNRGAITIRKNIMPGERVILRFSGEVTDTRLGANIQFEAEVVLETHDKAEDDYSISFKEDQIIRYNPFLDRLLEYDYKVFKGLITPSDTEWEKAFDANSYFRIIPFTVFRGAKAITTGYDVKIFSNVNGTLTEVPTDSAVITLTPSNITVDLRLIEKADYVLKLFVGNKEKLFTQFSFSLVRPGISGECVFGADINPADTVHRNRASTSVNGKRIELPEAYMNFKWFTDAYDAVSGKKTVEHEGGETVSIPLGKTGIGNKDNDSWLEVYFDATQKDPLYVATTETGARLTTEDGKLILFDI